MTTRTVHMMDRVNQLKRFLNIVIIVFLFSPLKGWTYLDQGGGGIIIIGVATPYYDRIGVFIEQDPCVGKDITLSQVVPDAYFDESLITALTLDELYTQIPGAIGSPNFVSIGGFQKGVGNGGSAPLGELPYLGTKITSLTPEGTWVEPTKVSVDFGDGIIMDYPYTDAGTSDIAHSYLNDGVYEIIYRVHMPVNFPYIKEVEISENTGGLGGYNVLPKIISTFPEFEEAGYNDLVEISAGDYVFEIRKTIVVETVTPQINVVTTSGNTTFCEGEEYEFSLTSTGGTVSSVNWILDNAAVSTEIVPRHSYLIPGTYSVTSSFSTDEGCSYSANKSVTVVPCIDPCSEAPILYDPSTEGPSLPIKKGMTAITCWSPPIGTTGRDENTMLDVLAIFETREADQQSLSSKRNETQQEWKASSIHNEEWTVDNLGTVFAVTLDTDDNPNIYVATTNIFERTFYDGGHLQGSYFPKYSNSIYKLDGTDGHIIYKPGQEVNKEPFASLNNDKRGQGIGSLTWDYDRNVLYASNFDDGIIYQIDPITGNSTALFDFNEAYNPSSPYYPFVYNRISEIILPKYGEVVWALKYYDDRLYFSVWYDNHSEVHSISLDATVLSSRLEVKLDYPGAIGIPDVSNVDAPITDIDFSKDGQKMLVSQRSMRGMNFSRAHSSTIYEYQRCLGRWVDNETGILFGPNEQGYNSVGGGGYLPSGDIIAGSDYITVVEGVSYGLTYVDLNEGTINGYTHIDLDQQSYTASDKSHVGQLEIYVCPPTGYDDGNSSLEISASNLCFEQGTYHGFNLTSDYTLSVSNVLWSFEDPAATTSLTTAYHKYDSPGDKRVGLELTISDGNETCIINESEVIPLKTCCNHTFGVNVQGEMDREFLGYCVDEPIQLGFSDPSFSDNLASIKWGFGDGNFSNALTPSNTYAAEGEYLLTAEIETIDGCFYEWSIGISVVTCVRCEDTPEIDIIGSGSVYFCVDDMLNFGFLGLNVSVPTVEWSFGDNSTSNDLTPFHQFLTAGSYNVGASITTDEGCVYNPTITIDVSTCETEPCVECIESFSPLIGKEYVLSMWLSEDVGTADVTSFEGIEVYVEFPVIGEVLGPFKPNGQIIDGWQRLEEALEIPLTAKKIKIRVENIGNNGMYMDDIRFHPFNSNMKSYVYDPTNLRLMAELDENNYATFYEYDEEGALVRVKKETVRGVMTIQESRNNTKKK